MTDKSGKRQSRTFINKADPAFDPITAALRQMHDGIANEPIPDDFLRLLEEIEIRSTAKNKPS